MDRPITTLFMLMSVDGKISTGATDDLDVDKDFPKIKGVNEGLHQYYEIEQTTDLWSFNSGRVQEKMGVNKKKIPRKTPVSFVVIDNNLSYLSASVPNGETFELEHIIARKRIDAADSSRPRHILGNSLGNCMYLPRGINNPKKDKTLYEINDHNRYSQLIKESQYFSEDEMQKAMQALTASDYESVNGLLRERSRQVAHTLVRALLKDSV